MKVNHHSIEKGQTMKRIESLFFAVVVIIGLLVALPTTVLAQPETYHVTIKQFNFHPPDLMINAGDTVVWENEMTYGHWVISGMDYRHDNRFFSYLLLEGNSFRFTFREPGEYHYYCPIHNMQAMVIVLEPEEEGKPEEKQKYGQRRRIR